MLDVSALKSLPNTRLLGEKHYQELPAFLSQFDVCTLPFRMNRLTKAVDPVKVYEYLSQGKPVVSVPLPELAPLSELLYFAANAAEFASQIDRALSEQNEALSPKRIEFASQNTWSARFEVLDREIRRHFPLVSILVVTYNTSEYLEPFLDSILRNTTYPCWEVVVVDNHSTDASPAILHRYASMDSRIRVKISERNLGFAGGNNHAASMAGGEYLVLLNPDTIVTSGWLEKLIHRLEQDPTTGMSAPVTNFSGNETKINTYYGSVKEMERFAAERARSKRGESVEVPAIPLLCGAIRKSLWEQLGGLDETFEIGTFEDDDLSARLREAGYRLVTAEDCFIHHFGNGSFGKLNSVESVRIFERNRKRFEAKWKTTWQPHKTRPGVRPISEEPRIPLAEFLEEEGTGGV
jgi:GT2 family glycosyltransferase